MAGVQFDKDNAMTCICTKCPVQTASACATDKVARLTAVMRSGTMQGMPSAADVPGLYCSTGAATCDDLARAQTCICEQCAVHAANGLTGWKYCEGGAAAQVG